MAQQCPNCGGFDISQETDRFHCLNCGNYFTYDNETATDGPAPAPLNSPEERVDEPEAQEPPTDHDDLAAAAQTGSEGIDAPAQTAEAPAPAEEASSGEAVSEPTQEPAQG